LNSPNILIDFVPREQAERLKVFIETIESAFVPLKEPYSLGLFNQNQKPIFEGFIQNHANRQAQYIDSGLQRE
jgi:hypothetical protein